jgi:hypothetical protein
MTRAMQLLAPARRYPVCPKCYNPPLHPVLQTSQTIGRQECSGYFRDALPANRVEALISFPQQGRLVRALREPRRRGGARVRSGHLSATRALQSHHRTLRYCGRSRSRLTTSGLAIEPHVFHAPAVEHAVDRHCQPFHSGMRAGRGTGVENNWAGRVLGQLALDRPNQLAALLRVGLH